MNYESPEISIVSFEDPEGRICLGASDVNYPGGWGNEEEWS